MNAKQYITLVAETVASLGHRDNVSFQKASVLSNEALGWTTGLRDQALQDRAEKCRNLIRSGLQSYVPGARWFDATSAVEYANLVAKYNSIVSEPARLQDFFESVWAR